MHAPGSTSPVDGAALRRDGSGVTIDDSVFLRACRREAVPFTPVWLMRQAGRYQPEYRAIRAKVSFLEGKATNANGGSVTVWVRAGERAAGLRGCLATAGLRCAVVGGEEPRDVCAGDAGAAVVVSARDGMERVRALRALAPGRPIVVVDVRAPAETTEAIRAGASDMLLDGAPDADLVAKLTRLMRRRARS